MELSSSKIKKVSYISGNRTLNFLRPSPKNKNIHPEKNFLVFGEMELSTISHEIFETNSSFHVK